MSEIRVCGCHIWMARRPSAADEHVRTSAPELFRIAATRSSPSRSSSTTRTRTPRNDGAPAKLGTRQLVAARSRLAPRAFAAAGDGHRQRHGERGAAALPGARRLDGASVQLDQMANQRQAETEPGVAPCGRAVRLLE